MKIPNNNTCSKCSNEVDTKMNFCANCGFQLSNNSLVSEKFITKSIVFYICFIGFLIVYYLIQPEIPSLLNELILESSFIIFILIFCLLDFKNILPLILFPKLSIPIYIFTFIFPVFSAIVVFYAINWLNNLLGFENANLFIRYASFENASLWAFIFVAFIPAIFEELAFRGYLFNQLSQVLTPQTTILVSSFLFALMHLSVFSLLWILPFGIVLGYLRNKYNTLWLGIIIHFIHNSIMLYVDIQS